MRQRIGTLRRLATLYSVVEEARSAELQMAGRALREAEDAIGMQRERQRSARVAGRAALAEGDRIGCILAETYGEIAGWNGEQLQGIRRERGALRIAAEEQYRASRMESEQMKRLRDNLTAQVDIVEGRRVQAVADDRFLARKLWMEMQGQRDKSLLI